MIKLHPSQAMLDRLLMQPELLNDKVHLSRCT